MRALTLMLALARLAAAAGSLLDVFVSGKEGYDCFRIPALTRTATGDLLAFAEGRRFSCADHGWNDIVMKRR
jgi:sialidase-1